MSKVGIGSVLQAGKQTAWGTSVTPTVKINLTSESIVTTAEKGDEGNLLPKKTRDQADLIAINTEGGIDFILRPEFVDWLFECAFGKKADNVYTLADVNANLPVSTFVISRGDIVKTYPDVTIRSLTLECPAQDYVRGSIDVIGTKELSAGESGAKTIQNINFTLPSYKCTGAVLVYGEGGSEAEELLSSLCVENVTLSLDNGAEEPNPTYCDGLYNGRPIPGLRVVNVDISLPYSDEVEAFRQDYLLNVESPTVALKLTFSTSNPDENVEIFLPNVSIMTADGNVDGQGVIESTISGEALSLDDQEPITATVNHYTPST